MTTMAPVDDENSHTTITWIERPPMAPAPREAFLLAHERLDLLAALRDGEAFAVVALGPDGRVVEGARLEAGSAAIVGRHTEATLRLAHEGVSLRHLALLVTHDAEGVTLRLWDLQTEHGVRTELGETRALATRGPAYVTIGPYGLWLVPTPFLAAHAGRRGVDVWCAVPRLAPVVANTARAPQGQGVWPDARVTTAAIAVEGDAGQEHAAHHAPCDDACDEGPGHTHIAPILLLGDDEEPEVPWGRLRLEHDGVKDARGVSLERLASGVLIGRYARCGLVLVSGVAAVSRVHVLLVLVGVDLYAIDTASTNGTELRGARVAAAILGDGDELVLGKQLRVRWTKQAHAEA